MSESMTERVARKMVAACNDQGEYTDGQYGLDGVVLDGSFDLLKVARAAIEEMREPTDAMNEALDRVPGGFGRGAWIEGIDTALSDTRDKG